MIRSNCLLRVFGRLLPLLCVAPLAACSQAETPAGLQRLPLSLEAGAPALGQDRRTRELLPPADVEPWRVEGGQATVRTVQEPGSAASLRVLALGEANLSVVHIPGPFDPAEVNRLRLEMISESHGSVSLQFMRGEEVLLRSALQPFAAQRSTQQLEFDLPQTVASKRPFDSLRLRFTSPSGRGIGIVGLEFWKRPLEAWLHKGVEAAPLIQVGGEARRGSALSRGRARTSRFRAAPGSTLRLGFGLPASVAGPGTKVRFRFELSEADDTILLEREFETVAGRGWERADFDLSDYAGRDLELRFEIVAGDVCALELPLLFQPMEAAPTVILVTSDTHRADYVSAMDGVPGVSTPVLDALAERGVLFTDCYSSTNVTNPSHTALMTGTHPRDTRLVTNNTPLLESARTLSEIYQSRGFRTFAAISLTNLGHRRSGLGQGFDRMAIPFPASVADAQVTIDQLLKWMDDAEGQPLFVWLHLFDAHTPYEPPQPYNELYWSAQRDPFDSSLPEPAVTAKELPPYLRGLRELEWPESQYRGEISYLDAQLKRLFEVPRVERGIVAVTADHGEVLGKHGIWFDHLDVYPDTLHIPLLMTGPDLPAGVRVDAAVRQIDLGRTLLDLSGLGGEPFPGKNLLRTLDGGGGDEQRFALSAQGLSAAIRKGKWHLIMHLRAHHEPNRLKGYEQHQIELFDLEKDPAGEIDCALEQPEIAAQLRAALLTWLRDTRGAGFAGEGASDKDVLEELAQLGYLEHATTFGESGWFEEDDCSWCARYSNQN